MNELIARIASTIDARGPQHGASAIAPGYMSGFGNSFETEALPRRLAGRPQLAAEGRTTGSTPSSCSGSPFTAPQAANQRTWLYRIRPTVRHTGRFRARSTAAGSAPRRNATRASCRSGQLRWSPIPMPERAAHLRDRASHHHHGGRCRNAGRHGEPRRVRHPLDGARAFLQCRRRTARGGAAEQPALPHRVRRDRHRAGRDLRHPARRHLPGRAGRRTGARLCVRELRRRLHAAGPRADRRQLPRQSARFPHAGRRLRGRRGAVHAARQMGRRAVSRPRFRIRRSTSSPGTAATTRTSTTCGASVRSARSCSTIPIRRSTRC